MPIYAAMNSLKSNIPHSVAAAQAFLNRLPPNVQDQLISAIYIGREHIHSNSLRNDMKINRAYTDHISKDEYANIIYEKGNSVITYFEKLELCAGASGFNLNSL